MSIDTIGAKMSKMRFKVQCYGCGDDHPKDKQWCPPRCADCHTCGKDGHFAKVYISGGEGRDIRQKGAAMPHDKHCGKSHKDRKQHMYHKCNGKKKLNEVTKGSDSHTGSNNSSSDSDDYEDGNIDELTFVITPINVDTLHRGSEVYLDLETAKSHVPF